MVYVLIQWLIYGAAFQRGQITKGRNRIDPLITAPSDQFAEFLQPFFPARNCQNRGSLYYGYNFDQRKI